MGDSPFEMRFDPKTVKHLGVRMYATLPPAVAEIVANAYDADASQVVVTLVENGGSPSEIIVTDDGDGLTLQDINEKFLVIGRNRRESDGDERSRKFHRKRIGKKGLGKLALFGLAKTIEVTTCRQGRKNSLVLDWDDLNGANGIYRPRASLVDVATDSPDGTQVRLLGLKRKSPFDAHALADSLSRIFIFEKNFKVQVLSSNGDRIALDNERRYRTLDVEFQWEISSELFVPPGSPYENKIVGRIMTASTPISPASGLRGITLFSRNKMVNSPEYFSSSASSHFYQYLTGWIGVDFIDEMDEDVISTNRQSLDWENPEIADLRAFLSGVVSQINADWRRKRREKKENELKQVTGIDTKAWMETMPADVRSSTSQIIESLGGEDALDKYTPVIKALHSLVPEYPLLHWRHLHPRIKGRIENYYRNGMYGDAASQGVQIYCEILRSMSGLSDDGYELVNKVFGSKPYQTPPIIKLNDLSNESEKNIQDGQAHLSRGIICGFRNPISHVPIDTAVPDLFSEIDCLNILSLVSYLAARLDNVDREVVQD